ncbi:MAG: hypothetical protein Q7S33_01545 [Nanoarchaeota archaeon]|nr:hypothetical protein [Nanoarchaeota archaeon]
MIKKTLLFVFLVSIFLIGFANSAGIVSNAGVCCEKTQSINGSGGYCITTSESLCDKSTNPKTNQPFRVSSTSCESTSYCKLGTCYDSNEGICSKTPQAICTNKNGTWFDKEPAELAQCQLGCCIISNQASFVPLVRCKKLSTSFGVVIDYRTDIKSDTECIAAAQSQDMGACVYEKEFQKTCKFTTRKDCSSVSGGVFNKDYLCSNPELATNCARQVSKQCYEQKVYWFDSCGNRENVYFSDKEISYNAGKITTPDKICSANSDANKNCGNCDYLLGTSCAISGIDASCRKNDCTANINGIITTKKNGESWCVYEANVGKGLDLVGSEHYKQTCINGEISTTSCASNRQGICSETTINLTNNGKYSVANCKANAWKDCVFQTKKDDCEDSEKRDCMWKPSLLGLQNFNSTDGVCVPYYTPGTTDSCALGNAKVQMTYEKGFPEYRWECKDNCWVDNEEYWAAANDICSSLGDCGAGFNYAGEYSNKGTEWKRNDADLVPQVSQNAVNQIKNKIGIDIIQKRLF